MYTDRQVLFYTWPHTVSTFGYLAFPQWKIETFPLWQLVWFYMILNGYIVVVSIHTPWFTSTEQTDFCGW